MTKSSSFWILTALLATVTAPASAQESEGPISRFMGRFRSSPAAHQHQHVHVQPAPTAYVYAEPEPQVAVVEVAEAPAPAPMPEPAPLAEAASETETEAEASESVADQASPVQAEPAYVYATEPQAHDHGGGCDPYGFVYILNRIRASAGLHPLSYDPNLSSWAHQNNAEQCRRGLGHHVNPGGIQNCAYNYTDANSTAAGWMNSPGHRRNMLSPSATHFGIAFGPGPYWTLNAR